VVRKTSLVLLCHGINCSNVTKTVHIKKYLRIVMCCVFRTLIRFVIYKYPTKCTSLFMIDLINARKMEYIKLMNNRQEATYAYKNTKQLLLKETNAAVWFNKMCRSNHLTPVSGNNCQYQEKKRHPKHCSALCRLFVYYGLHVCIICDWKYNWHLWTLRILQDEDAYRLADYMYCSVSLMPPVPPPRRIESRKWQVTRLKCAA